jgi:hypothetical protein
MFRRSWLTAASAAAVVVVAGIATAKSDVKPFVTCPPTWEAAIEEGKALNLPIVVHSHGFY